MLAPLLRRSKQFPALSKTFYQLMLQSWYQKTAQSLVYLPVRQKVTIATKLPAEPPLILALSINISKTVWQNPFYINYQILISWIRIDFGFIHMTVLLLQATFF